ncbi:CAP (Cysteine-rich secretory proteins, Antigen 5, and Pathogenesis-related 1 protein) superfamily protein [Arabidopsis thaliana]|uniref:CAP (Cysteine-rich secretory proteins, Antigen 5, and Pathogenesis-related 1 protein) superfamily protein n=1 Tax=Arabidopsis thaliana TaxID=3702 RepID=F4I4X9_ARATH|nr:CAP (Cysteine-rich secretory proteins, Antigen 5, and Pathogenesis-related 1 protein) superfamily protein [Arabidopsis thaliana]AEE32512.1 CAP (Cysteine-rich secretory proteins, Antigen 5, and Pathogenesis-related 1 protein) superfamily protein [Arabidopsis thaliana]|eukprot:NP_175427.1 CAP (Cysteine-rich secretory proteins, Antigen 5, and Pathogenesis-related 1 protein) superfamily protein [Arabidopsis thaliana]
MNTFKTPFLIIVAISFLVLATNAQNAQQDYLNTHNTARAQVGVANVVWDTVVAAYATNYANARKVDCSLTPSTGGSYGENLANGNNALFTGVAAVNLWVNEKPYYNYTANACIGAQQCKHYTQVVWSNSVKIGCARVLCNNGGYFVGCNYDASAALKSRKITASVRQTRGLGASAACGQLRNKFQKSPSLATAEGEVIEARLRSEDFDNSCIGFAFTYICDACVGL